MNTFKEFSRLHHESSPLLLGNIWDVHSAQVYARAGYKAIGTSSMAVAHAWGFEDGEQMPFDTLLQVAKRVKAVTSIPLTVDVEGGYSRTISGIVENIKKLHDLGVAGINLEDTIPAATRQLRPVAEFQAQLAGIAEALSRHNISIFINVRTDGFLLALPNALPESLARIKAYEQAGAHGIFVPGITAVADIQQVVDATALPINVMCMPSLPDYKTLTTLGVKRISTGPFLQSYVHKKTEEAITAIGADGNFSSLFR